MNREQLAIKFGERLRESRLSKNMSQTELAAKIKLTPQWVSNIENGRRCPDLLTYIKIQAHFIHDLLEGFF